MTRWSDPTTQMREDVDGRVGLPPPSGGGQGSFGLNSQTLVSNDLTATLRAASSAGFRAVELTGGELDGFLDTPLQAAAHLTRAQVELIGVCPAPDLMRWHHAWDTSMARLLRARLPYYRDLGAAYLVLPFMSAAGDRSSALRGLAAAAEIAGECGIGLAVESIGHVPNHERLEDVRALIDEVASPVVGVCLDSFHFYRAGQSLDDLAALEGTRVWVNQLSNASRSPLCELVGYRDRSFPLDGPLDLVSYCREVERWAPNVPHTAEVLGDLPWALTPAEGSRRAFIQLSELQDLTRPDLRKS